MKTTKLEELDDEVAAGAICPKPECGALVIAFRATYIARPDHIQPWEFACLRCGIEFVVPENELVFSRCPRNGCWRAFISRRRTQEKRHGSTEIINKGVQHNEHNETRPHSG